MPIDSATNENMKCSYQLVPWENIMSIEGQDSYISPLRIIYYTPWHLKYI